MNCLEIQQLFESVCFGGLTAIDVAVILLCESFSLMEKCEVLTQPSCSLGAWLKKILVSVLNFYGFHTQGLCPFV